MMIPPVISVEEGISFNRKKARITVPTGSPNNATETNAEDLYRSA
jgi:hypothetical protein